MRDEHDPLYGISAESLDEELDRCSHNRTLLEDCEDCEAELDAVARAQRPVAREYILMGIWAAVVAAATLGSGLLMAWAIRAASQ